MSQEPSQLEADPSQAIAEPDSGYEYCSNCGVKLSGLYCHRCGQSSKSMIKFFGEVARELLEDTIGYDSRIKHSITPLLFKPGRITLDYIKGKRFFYVMPFRLYLITSLILILLIKGATDANELKFDNIVNDNSGQQTSEEIRQEINDEVAKELNEINVALNQRKKATEGKPELAPNPSLNSPIDSVAGADPDLNTDPDTDKKPGNTADPAIEPPAQTESLDVNESDSINVQWDSETQQLTGLENLEANWFRSFLEVINPKIKKWKEDPEPLIDAFFETLPYIMFLILPIFAIFLKVFYAFSKRYYIEHLVFLLHNHAFIYLVMMLEIILEFSATKLKLLDNGIVNSIATGLDWIGTLLFYWMLIYVFLAMKRFYQQGWGITIFKTLSLGFIYLIMLGFGFMLTLAYGAYQA